MMNSCRSFACGFAYSGAAVVAICLSAAGPASAALVTASAIGTFDDGAGWTAVATWDDSVMNDNEVLVSEMFTFTVVTQPGPVLAGATYDMSETAPEDGFTFDGPTPGASITGAAGGYYIGAIDSAGDEDQLDMHDTWGMEEHTNATGTTRTDLNWGDGTQVWTVTGVPEPSTVMLLALGAVGMVGSGGRRRRRR